MSGPWEQFQGGAATAEEDGPWARFAKPAQPPAPAQPPLRGTAAMPGSPEDQQRQGVMPAQAQQPDDTGLPPPIVRPPQPAGVGDKITGLLQAGLNIGTSLVGGAVGGLTGFAQHMAEGAGAITTAADRASRGVPTRIPGEDKPISLEQAQAEHSAGITKALRDIPLNAAPTAKGEEYTEAARPAIESLGALGGHMGELGGASAMVKPGLAMAAEDTAGAVAPVVKPAVQAAGKAARGGAQRMLGVDPELAKVAQTASDLKYPIDVRPDQVVKGAKFSKLAGQAASDYPLAGSKKTSNIENFTKNVIDQLNPESEETRLTPDVYAEAMDRSGKGIGDIAARTPVPEADISFTELQGTLRKATEDNQRIVNAYVDDVKNAAGENGGVVDGTRLKEINSEIGQQARANAGNDLGRHLNDLQDVIQGAVEKNASPADVQPLRDFRRQYAYGKMLEPDVAKTIDGLMDPSALMATVTRTKAGKNYMAKAAGGPIGDLAKVGKLIAEPKSSGTAERSLLYGMAKDTGKAVAGVLGGHPASLLYNKLGPKVTRAVVGQKERPVPPAAPPEPPPLTASQTPFEPPPTAPEGPQPLATPQQMWTTSAGAAPPAQAGGIDPAGLVRPVGAPLIGQAPRAGKNAGNQIPAVPGRPDVPERMLSGAPAESAATERANAAMLEPGAVEARAQQSHAAMIRRNAAEPRLPVGEVTEGQPPISVAKTGKIPVGEATESTHDQYVRQRNDQQRREMAIPVGEVAEGQPPISVEKPGRIPVGKTIEGQPNIATEKPGKIPVGEATEIKPQYIERGIPVGEATEITPEQIEAADSPAWRHEHGLGVEDAGRAKFVAFALQHDPEAVEAAAKQFENSPRAFDRAIAKINEQGEQHANESKRSAGGREGPNNDRTDRPSGGGDGAAPVPAGKEAAPAVRGAEQGAEPGRAVPATGDAAGGERPNGVEIREVPGGFDAYKGGKKVGYLRDNLERGQAAQINENANVNIVKVNKELEGQGIGRALYQAFHEKHEGRIMPSGKTEPPAWKVWKRSYPEKVTAFVKQEAQRIRDGADPKMVAGNITDSEVRTRVLRMAEK